MKVMNIRATILSLLFITYFTSAVYGQDASLSCDEHSNLTNAFLESFNEIINIEINQANRLDVQDSFFLSSSHQEIDKTIRGDYFKQHIRYLAPIVWHCSKDAREYNEIVITALAIYSDESTPHSVKEYILQFLSFLSQEYQNKESIRADQNVLTRSTSYFSKVSIPALVILQMAKTSILKRLVFGKQVANFANYLMNLSRRSQVAIFVGTPILVGSGLEATEWLEDILDGPRFDPTALIDSTLLSEMHNLAISACDLTEDLKQQEFDQSNSTSFEGFNLRYQYLNKTYEMLSEFRPGYYIPQNSNPQDLANNVESAKNMDERLEQLFESWSAIQSNHGVCNNMINMSLLVTSCHLQESQQRLNNSPFSLNTNISQIPTRPQTHIHPCP